MLEITSYYVKLYEDRAQYNISLLTGFALNFKCYTRLVSLPFRRGYAVSFRVHSFVPVQSKQRTNSRIICDNYFMSLNIMLPCQKLQQSLPRTPSGRNEGLSI